MPAPRFLNLCPRALLAFVNFKMWIVSRWYPILVTSDKHMNYTVSRAPLLLSIRRTREHEQRRQCKTALHYSGDSNATG